MHALGLRVEVEGSGCRVHGSVQAQVCHGLVCFWTASWLVHIGWCILVRACILLRACFVVGAYARILRSVYPMCGDSYCAVVTGAARNLSVAQCAEFVLCCAVRACVRACVCLRCETAKATCQFGAHHTPQQLFHDTVTPIVFRGDGKVHLLQLRV